MTTNTASRRWARGVMPASALAFVAALSPALAQEEADAEGEVVELETFVAEEAVEDDLGVLPREPVDSVFGFGKTVLETPRAVSSISAEFLDEFNITSINDIVTFVPGTFTTSFFGVAGSLDVRGTSAENYFRGVKRLNNDGNFPTPIGASDRIDVIRGPMSPISGPSKVGGALNFIPKSARAESGQYLPDATGALSYTAGSWDKSVITAEVGGPLALMGRTAGYYLFAEVENSDSFYWNDYTRQNLVQTSFNVDISGTLRTEFGFMYQEWRGHENGGWNRVTQDLIDRREYITGRMGVNIDQMYGDGNGLIEESEIDAFEATLPGLVATGTPFVDGVTCFTAFEPFCFEGNFAPLDPANMTQELVDSLGLGLDPETVGRAKLKPSHVLIHATDIYDTDANVAYFDLIYDGGGRLTITNKLFYESLVMEAVDGYGFSKMGDNWVVEDQLIFAFSFEGENAVANFQVSPSIRHTDGFFAIDFFDEIFDRVDLTQGFDANSLLQAATRDPRESWSAYTFSEYTQLAVAALADVTFSERLNVLLGVRQDWVDIEVEDGDGDGPVQLVNVGAGERKGSENDGAFTWSASVSYAFPSGFTPYVTAAEQSTLISGQMAEVSVGNVLGNTFLGESKLLEYGVKASFLDGRAFAGVAVFEQERIDFNAQNPTNNQASESEGYEVELRYVPTDRFSFVATYSQLETFVVQESGVVFSFIGASNLPHINPATIFGGLIGGNHAVGRRTPRGGIPEATWSLSGMQQWTERFRTGFTFTSVDETEASVIGGIVLPAYEVLSLTGTWERGNLRASLYLNNVTDELYFRGNFPSLYGNNNVLPNLPFNWSAEVAYSF